MNLGWKLFRHSLMVVLRNYSQVLQIFLIPSLLVAAFSIASWCFVDFGNSSEVPDNLTIGLSLVGLAIWLFVVGWTQVAWHRFILLEEQPTGWIQPVRFDRVFAFIGRFIRATVFTALIWVALVLLFSSAVLVVHGDPPEFSSVFDVVSGVVFCVIFLHLSLILPATAIGGTMNFRAGWKTARRESFAILVAALCWTPLGFIDDLIREILVNTSVPQILFGIPAQLLTHVFGASFLTTLYGNFVENRPLN